MNSPTCFRWFPGLSSRWMQVLLVLSLSLSVYAAVKIRPFSVPDESAHYFRTLEVSRLHLINYVGNVGVDIPCEEYKYVGNANGPIANYVDVDPMIRVATPDRPCLIRSVNTAGAYSPVMYIFSGMGFAFADLFNADYVEKHYWGRVFNAVAGTLITILALCMINYFRPLLALAAFVPMGFWLRSSLSADSVTYAVALFYLCWLIRCVEDRALLPARRYILNSLILAGVIGATKPLYCLLPFGMLILFNPREAIKTQSWLLIPGLLSTATAFVLTNLFDTSLIYVPQGLIPMNQLLYILTHPIDYLVMCLNTARLQHTMLLDGILGVQKLPYLLMVLVLCITTQSILNCYQRAFIVLLAFAITLAIAAALYIVYTPLAHTEVLGLQGRLFIIPLALFLLAIPFPYKNRGWHVWLQVLQNVIGYVLSLAFIYYSLTNIDLMRAIGMA